MTKHRLVFIMLTAAAILAGCTHAQRMTPAGDGIHPAPAMAPLGKVSTKKDPAPVFGPPEAFSEKSSTEAGEGSLFPVRRAESNRIAVLKNGDASFAARIGLLEKAETSIRIQALVFSGDESGLYPNVA